MTVVDADMGCVASSELYMVPNLSVVVYFALSPGSKMDCDSATSSTMPSSPIYPKATPNVLI